MMTYPRIVSTRTVLALTAALSAVGCGGSGPKLVPAKGVITFKNKPLAGMSVYLVPHPADGARKQASGYTGLDGSFTLTTESADGIEAGQYKVVVTAEMLPERALAKYGQIETTPLPPVTVPAEGAPNLTFDLK